MSIRAGIASLRRQLDRVKAGETGLLGLAERMRRRKRLRSEGVTSPSTAERHQETLRRNPPESLAYKMAAQALRRISNHEQ